MAKNPRNRGGGGNSPRDVFRQAETRAVGAAAQTATGTGVVTPPVSTRASARPSEPKKKVPPGQFINEVRAEGRKITWPSRRETWITSVMVFIMVVIAAIFFAIVDGTLSFLLQQALRLLS